ncbi:MAG: Sensor histidine kinase ResE [Chloroflexi bacterium]|nr:Sensor histidine kinase ResE [Chloroflexota bacterium]
MIRWKRSETPFNHLFGDQEQWLQLGFRMGVTTIPLFIVGMLKEWAGGMSSGLLLAPQTLGKMTITILGFGIIHSGLLIADSFFQKLPKNKFFQRGLAVLGLVNFLPLPFILIAVQAYPIIKIGSFAGLSGILATAEILIYEIREVRSQANRQLEELSTLNQISQALQSTLALDDLLPIIHQQVTDFLGIDNFYVALYDEERDELWYPLAVKHDQRQSWPRRPMEDRLTDRVILEKKAILLTPKYQQGSDYIGLPSSAETPHSWMGVPLITSERALGCLAVMGFDPKVEFTTSDLNLLKTLSGQVSVAIENALLYASTDQALTRRVQQLGMLERVGRELSAELDLDRLFELILQSVLKLTNAKVGGVALYNKESKQINMKVTQGYDNPLPTNSSIGITGRVARTKQAQNVPDVQEDEDYYELHNGGTRSQLSVPMLYNERLLGIITIESDQLGAFSENDQAFISQLADQAAIAVVNAELFSSATQERDRLDTVLDSVGEAILMIQSDGRVLLANKLIPTFTGTQLNEIIGVHFSQLPASAQRVLGNSAEEVTPLEEILSGKYYSWPITETYKVKAPQHERVINRGVLPVGEGAEGMRGIVIVLRDITEEIRIRQERELINETLVHNLRSPTSAVLGALDLIEDILPEGEDKAILTQSVRVAQRGTQRVLRLINTLLDISRLEAGRMELILDHINAAEIVDDLLIEFIPLANRAGIILENKLPDDLPPLWADADKLKRIIANLVDNAIKFTPEGGQVVISASQHGEEELLFQVRDTGPGIPADYQQEIFSRFVQVPGLSGRRRGSGLGLTFCHLAVEAHGGKIWVDENPEGGSLFNFTLPQEGPPADDDLIMRRSG